MTFSREEFVGAMRRFPGAANIITTGTGDSRAGFTATACISLAADPPQVGVAVNRTVSSYPQLVENGYFCINTLASDQLELASRFSGPIKGAQRFLEGKWTELKTGAPVLEGAVVNLDCKVTNRLELSTHTLFVGEVVAARQAIDAKQLLYVDGDWASLLPATGRDVAGVMDGIHTVTSAVERASRLSDDPLANLEAFVKEWTKIYTTTEAVTQKYMSAKLYVSPIDLQALNAAGREFDDRLTALLAQGVEAGCLEAADPRLTAYAISGLVGWIHRWYRPDGRLSPEEIGQYLAVLVRKMVSCSDKTETSGSRTGVI
ncbi:flavin reductase [Paraburkholderia xenovorans]